MSERARELAGRIQTLTQQMIEFVQRCPDDQWTKVSSAEQWPVGVVARHFAAGHLGALELAKMIVAGTELPPLTREAIDQSNAEHAREHADSSKAEVLGFLRENGSAFAATLPGLSDDDLDRTGDLPAAGGPVSTQNFLEYVVLQSGGSHLESLRATVG